MAIDAISVLGSIPFTNPVGNVNAPANQTPSTVTPIGTEPSVFVQFSTFVRNLLAQQAANPEQNIDDALAKSLAGLAQGSSTSSPLYTATGLLQQYATSQLLSQLDSTNSDAQTRADIADAARLAALNTELSALNPTDQPTQPGAPVNNAIASATRVDLDATNTDTAATATAASPLTVADETAAPQNAQPAAVGQADSANTGAPFATPTVSPNANTPLITDFDPYQRAALAAGMTSFGKELNSFVPAATDPTLDSPLGPVAAITRIKSRSDVPEDAQAASPA